MPFQRLAVAAECGDRNVADRLIQVHAERCQVHIRPVVVRRLRGSSELPLLRWQVLEVVEDLDLALDRRGHRDATI
jgi:hypothetical protein